MTMVMVWRDGVEIEVPVAALDLPEAPPPLMTPTVSSAQARLALYNAGLLDDLEAIIAAHPYRPVRIWYEGANMWERTNPYVSILGPELGLTEEQIDALFIAAANL